MDTSNILPDSRLKNPKGTKRVLWPWQGKTVALECEPVFCANCGKLHGYVPMVTTTFACWLCNECAEAMGPIAGTMMMPDEAFWKKVEEESGGVMNFAKLQALAEEAWGAMAKLLRERPKGRV